MAEVLGRLAVVIVSVIAALWVIHDARWESTTDRFLFRLSAFMIMVGGWISLMFHLFGWIK